MDYTILAYDYAPVGIVLTENRIIRSCNQTFADLFGYQKHELYNQSFRMLYGSQKEFDRIRDIGIGTLEQKGVYSDERIMQHRDDTWFWCRFRAQTLSPENPLAQTVLSFSKLSEADAKVILTSRERQVVGYLSLGQTSKEIAKNLSLSPRTIEDVRARLLKKFKVKNATALLVKLGNIEA
ncbi:PAS and helix-turn-helix domain-containing protein [Amylibacter sp. SFDW26]|nr:PAS and helix-turn-helix domain-containing protein [Amylibacter sp. SFDW26]